MNNFLPDDYIPLIQKNDPDRFFITVFAPKEIQDPLLVLYAFNFELSRILETISDPMVGQIKFQWWWDFIDALFDESKAKDKAFSHHPLFAGMKYITSNGFTSKDELHLIIKGQETVLDESPPARIEDLIEIIGQRSDPLFDIAARLERYDDVKDFSKISIAWGLVGLIRAVPYHAKLGKIYIPSELFKKYINPDHEGVMDLKPETSEFKEIIKELAQVAQSYLDQALSLKQKSHLKLYAYFDKRKFKKRLPPIIRVEYFLNKKYELF